MGPLRKPWILAVGAGVLLGMAGPYLSEPTLQGPLAWWNPYGWPSEVYWHRLLGLCLGAQVGMFAYAVVALSSGLTPMVRRIPFPEIFDPDPFQPVVAHGLTNGLLVAGLLSLISLFALDLGLTPLLLLFLVLTISLIGTSTLLPLREVRRRIRTRKAEELAWCDSAVRKAGREVRDGREPTGEPGLADLAAYRRLLQEVREWPLDLPAFRRILLYLAIPLGSWVASALVQHVVEVWIGSGR
jgi:hypothetical protein